MRKLRDCGTVVYGVVAGGGRNKVLRAQLTCCWHMRTTNEIPVLAPLLNLLPGWAPSPVDHCVQALPGSD